MVASAILDCGIAIAVRLGEIERLALVPGPEGVFHLPEHLPPFAFRLERAREASAGARGPVPGGGLRHSFAKQAGHQRLRRHRAELHASAPRPDGGKQRIGVRAEQQERGCRRRLLQRLQERILRPLVHGIGGRHDGDLPASAQRREREAPGQGPHVVHADLLGGSAFQVRAPDQASREQLRLRHEEGDIGEVAALDSAAIQTLAARTNGRIDLLAVRRLGERARQQLLAYAFRPGEEVCVVHLPALQRAPEQPDCTLLSENVLPAHECAFLHTVEP